MLIHGLRTLGALTPAASAVSVGAGAESVLYWMANQIQRIVATDLYDNPLCEGQPGMLTNPEQFAPFPYRRKHLEVLRMSGDDLDFPDAAFDFAFCLSSIEHFGSREIQRKALDEMRRVVKPGGIVAITTELILSEGSHPEYFSYPELRDIFLNAPGLQLIGGDLDLRIAQSLIEYPVDVPEFWKPGDQPYNGTPHIVLWNGRILWTDISLFFVRTEL